MAGGPKATGTHARPRGPARQDPPAGSAGRAGGSGIQCPLALRLAHPKPGGGGRLCPPETNQEERLGGEGHLWMPSWKLVTGTRPDLALLPSSQTPNLSITSWCRAESTISPINSTQVPVKGMGVK